ncbi:GNAT family N-acetyltransferase [Luteipulveratus mongoliensis]|uniref:GNAT family N-acetyltransferase n=1 Tax=Luteipulveratus mongoliensis TaxID=571913 RepID=UPI000695E398|nr:GNAT family N-acetyltransferase [Luteipulveratus mongoliensis]
MTDSLPLADVTELTDPASVLEHTQGDPFVRYDIRLPTLVPPVALGRAVALVRIPKSRLRRPSLTFVGPADDVEALIEWYTAHGLPEVAGAVTVERPLEPVLRRHVDVGTGGDWDWMWTTDEPAVLAEEALLTELDDRRDARDVLRLNEIGNPSAESEPGEGTTERWVGVRSGGELIAAAAMHRTTAGAPHLTGIVVHPDHRGRRLGLAMTGALTRTAVRQDGVCTLGVNADNDTAHRVYVGLGYRLAHAWASRRLT